MYCPQCGEELARGAKFCSKCGNPQPERIPQETAAPSSPPRRTGTWWKVILVVVGGWFALMIGITITTPKLARSRMFAQENAAIASIRTLHTAEVQFYSQYGRYATSLAELGPSATGVPGPAAADLIGVDLATGVKQGYRFTLIRGGDGGYKVNAVPEVYGSSGSRTFFSDQTMIIRQNYGPEPASASSPELR